MLSRHLRVLDAFDSLHPERRLIDIERATGLSHATAHRLTTELEREGLLERGPDQQFRLGIRLWEYAARTPGGLGLRELARPWMNAVHARVRQHVQLGVRSGLDVLFIERMSMPDAVVNATLIGGRIPLPLSASGIVLLAHSPEDLIAEVIERGWPEHTGETPRGENALRARVRAARADGFAVTDGFIYEDSRGIAVPIMGAGNKVHGALGVVVPNDGSDPRPTIELLAVAAAGIARAIDDARLPGGGASGRGEPRTIRPLISPSRATLEYFAALGVAGESPYERGES